MKLTIQLTEEKTTKIQQYEKWLEELEEFETAIYEHQIDPNIKTVINVIDEGFDVIKSGLKYLKMLDKNIKTEFETLEVKVCNDELFDVILNHSDRFKKNNTSTRIGVMLINNLIDFLCSFCFEEDEDILTHMAYNDIKNEKRQAGRKVYLSDDDVEALTEAYNNYDFETGLDNKLTKILKSIEN